MLQKNFSGRKNDRRIKARERLNTMLNTGKTIVHREVLDKDDITRIKKEIKTLDDRILEPTVARGMRTKKFRGVK